jgi:MFS family permease
MTGILSGLPHLLRVIFSLCVSTVCDHLLTTNKMSRTNVRKLATFLSEKHGIIHGLPVIFQFPTGLILNGLFVIGLAFAGCHVILAVVLLTISLMLHGAVSSGALASVVDISPNFAGVSLGINSSFSVFTGFVSPLIVGYLTFGRQSSIEPWKYVFAICATMQIICGILYLLFSDSSLQEWNKPQHSPEYSLTTQKTKENGIEGGIVGGLEEEKRLR